MQVKSRISGFTRDYQTGELVVSLVIPKEAEAEFKDLVDAIGTNNIGLQIEKFKNKKKRSLDANAYLWVLCTKLAEVNKSTKEEEYENALRKYGCFDTDSEGNYKVFRIKREHAEEVKDTFKSKGFHVQFLGGDYAYVDYAILKGTSEYTTYEMSVLLNGLVEDCKKEGIETISPEELERLWHINQL